MGDALRATAGLPWTTLRVDHRASLRPQDPPPATTDKLVHSCGLAASFPPRVKIQSAGWVKIRPAPTVQHHFRRSAKPYSHRRFTDRGIDHDRGIEHEVQQLLVAPFRTIQLQLLEACALLAKESLTEIPISAMSAFKNFSRLGGVFRYSTTSGSTPLLRIMASGFRDLPHAGLR